MKLSLLRPVDKKFPISSPFGKTRVINGVLSPPHKGIDFACPVGTPIKACAMGVVYRSGWENDHNPKQGFGLRVMQRILLDGVAYYIFYGHCNKLLIEAGEIAQEGEIIAESGNTGSSTGPHLHVGARRGDTDEFFDIEFRDAPEEKKEA